CRPGGYDGVPRLELRRGVFFEIMKFRCHATGARTTNTWLAEMVNPTVLGHPGAAVGYPGVLGWVFWGTRWALWGTRGGGGGVPQSTPVCNACGTGTPAGACFLEKYSMRRRGRLRHTSLNN